MGKLTDFVMANKVRELSAEERMKIIRQENERRMAEVRERLRKRERENELEKIKQEFSIVGAEYVYAYHGEDTTTLRPTWLFTVEVGESEKYFAVDAITGELLSE